MNPKMKLGNSYPNQVRERERAIERIDARERERDVRRRLP